MKQHPKILSVVVLMLSLVNICAQDWPQYLGPNRNSTSPQTGILRTWPAGGPEVLWSANIGIGYGGPVVSNGKVFLLDRDDATGDMLKCFELSSGKELWKFAYSAPGSVMFPGSRSVPVVDGNYVYSCGPYGDLYCFDIGTQQPVWKKNVWTDFGGGEIPTWAISQCPIIYHDLLIIASQAPQAGVVAYNKLTGDVKWQTPNLGAVGYVSPVMVKAAGEDQVVMITAANRGGFGQPGTGGKVVGLNPLTGKTLWEYSNWQCIIPVPVAFDAGDSKVLITGGYEAGAAMIKIEKKSDGSYGVTELYKNVDFGAHTQPPLLYNGYFYAQYSTNERKDGLVCMSTDGKVMWKTGRDPNFERGAMILADGVILATDGANKLYLIEPDANQFKPLASAEILAGSTGGDERAARFGVQNWAPIALTGGKLLIRDQSRLLCVKVAQ
jgi:outer membrane protein assembly factor BamB